jgi:hypothetical protein
MLGPSVKSTRIVLIWIWLIVGSALGLYCAMCGFRAIADSDTGETQAAIASLLFAVVVVLGAVEAKRGRRFGVPLLHVASVLGLLYSVVYWLFGGIIYSGLRYALLVGSLLVLSVITLVALRREARHES